MTSNYILLFKPFRPDDADANDPAVLRPILVHDDGRQIALNKVVTSVEKAMSMDAGFAMVRWIEDVGGFEAVMEIIEKREAGGDNDVHSSEE